MFCSILHKQEKNKTVCQLILIFREGGKERGGEREREGIGLLEVYLWYQLISSDM